MSEVGKDLRKHLVQPPGKQGALQHMAQRCDQALLGYLQGRSLRSPSGQPAQRSGTLTAKKFFLMQ